MTTNTEGASNTNPGGDGSSTGTTATTTTNPPPQDTTATVQNPSEGQEGNGNGEPKKDAGTITGAPEAYTAFNMPEGTTLEGERLDLANTAFKGLNLSQEQAQGLVDLYVKLQGDDSAAMAQLFEEQRVQQTESWGAEARQAFGDKYDQTVGLARTAVQHLNDPNLTKAFNELGWGNHPALIGAFAKFGELLRDSKVDGLGGGTANGVTEKTPAQVLYPNDVK